MPRITYDITATGGVEVARGFAAIAQAAKTSQAQLERQNRQTSAGLAATSAAMRDLRASAEASLSQLGPLGAALSALGRAGPAGAAVAGLSVLGVGLTAAAFKAIALADELKDAADIAGLSSDRFQSLRFALAGIGVDEAKLSSFLNKFEKNLGDVYDGTGTLTEKLKDIDPALLDAIKHAPSVEAAFDLILQKLESMPNAAQRAALAQAAFGKGAQAIAASAHTGADGLRALEEAAHATGTVINAEFLAAASSASDRLAQMSLVIQSNLVAALVEVAPQIEAVTVKIINLTAAVGRFVSGRQQGEKFITPEIADLNDQIALLERFHEGLRGGGPELEQERAKTLDDILALNKKREALLEVATAEKAARDAAAAPVAGGPDEAARKKAQTDQERADAILANARRQAATAGLEGEARAREQAKQDIEEKSAELKKLITDEKAAADAIAEYKLQRTAELEKELTKIHEEEAKKQAVADEQHRKQQEAADRRMQGQVRAARRARTSVGGDTEASIWQDASEAFEEYQHDLEEGIEDEQRRRQLAADFWVETEATAQAKVQELRTKEAEKAADQAEKDAKKAAAARDEMLKPFENTLQNIQRTLGDALVNVFTDGEAAAQSFEEVVLDIVKTIAAELVQLALSKAVVQPLLGALAGKAGAAPTGAAGAGLEQAASGATSALQTFGSGLLKYAGAAVAVAGTLYQAGTAIAAGSKSINAASQGQRGPGNAFAVTAGAGTAVGVGAGAGIGAAVGSAVPGIGTLVGAAVGAAVGGVLSQVIAKELGGSLSKGIQDGVSKGLTQGQLEKQVGEAVSGNFLLNVISGGLNTVLAPLLSPLFVPDIERIFEKILRQQLGGVGGFNTTGVSGAGASGLPQLLGTAGRAGRIIAEGFGAGGEAFGGKREAGFSSLLLAVTKREAERTGQDEGHVLAEVFATAFQGSFMEALRAAFKTGKGRRAADFQFVAGQFSEAAGGFNYQTIADVVSRQGRAPGTNAMKASQDAVQSAMSAAFANAADSQAFRRSLADSVAAAFGDKAVSVLVKSMGDVFAPFFALSKDARKEFRRERRQGDFPAALEILTEDFVDRIQDFAKVVADPQVVANLDLLADAMLQLQVATAVASGDIVGAASIIEGALSASIQQLRDIQQLRRDVESRTRLALAGPGIAGDREGIADARRVREEAQARLEGFGKIGFFGGSGKPFGATVGPGGTQVTPLEPSELIGPLREFADARLDELEQEIALARQLADTFEALSQQFGALRLAVAATLGRADPTADLADKIKKVADAQAAIGSTNLDEVDPDKFADLATALSDAIGAASARFAELTQAIATFDAISRGIADTLGGLAAQGPRLDDLFGSMAKLLPTVVGGGKGSQAATRDLASQLQEAVGIATSRRAFFGQAQEGFEGIRDQAAIAARGTRAQRQQLARGRAELAALLPQALAGDADALARAQALSSQILTLAGSGARGRRVAREIEQRSTLLAAAAEKQKTIADESLAALQVIAETAKTALEGQKTTVEAQLDALGTIASQAEVQSKLLFVGFTQVVENTKALLEDFRTTYGPLIANLEAAAKVTLHQDLVDIKAALGSDGEIAKAIRLVEARLPAGVTSSGQRLAVTNTAPAPEPVTMNTTVHLTVALPAGTSPAQARELGRSTATGVDEAVQTVIRRHGVTLGLRKVA